MSEASTSNATTTDYRSTLNLPDTPFPMRGDLPKREPGWVREWDEQGLYQRLRAARAGAPKFVLHDGPPYANGAIHLGHLVEYIQTDIWTRFQKMRGHECWYVCADDTHGTPIMLAAEKAGLTAEQFIADIQASHEKNFAAFGVKFDHYDSTHSAANRKLTEEIIAWHDVVMGKK